MTDFSGIWVPLVTPFKDGEVDYESAKKLARHMMNSGVNGLVVCGTTGEAASLNPLEKVLLLETVMGEAYGHCPVLMGLSGSNTRELATEARTFALTGIDGYLLSAPCYVRPSQAGIIEHFRHIAKGTCLPIIIYNIPSRTGVNMEPETIGTLCTSKQFVAVKECGGLPQMMTLLADAPCKLLCGDDSLMFSAFEHGGHGAISASAHLFPELFVQMFSLARQGKFNNAKAIFTKLSPLIQVLFSEPNPGPVKAALAMQGWIRDELRLPMMQASDACKEQLRHALAAIETYRSTFTKNGAKAYAA